MTNRTRIKICGITSVADAQLAVSAGADYLGLIFVPESPRSVSLETAKAIAEAVQDQAQLVGVFRNAYVETIQAAYRQIGFHTVQLHGQENIAEYTTLATPLIRALGISLEALPNQPLQELMGAAQHLLIDRPKEGYGPDWLPWMLHYLAGIPARPSLFIAGGLTPENVSRVIRQLRPFGVDVASGVETAPGMKDPEKLRAFCAAVRACDNEVKQQREEPCNP